MHELRHKREKKLRRLVSRHRHQHHISHRRHHITAITPRPSLHHNDHQLPPFHPHTRRLLAALRAGAPPAAPPTISIIVMPRRAALLLGRNAALALALALLLHLHRREVRLGHLVRVRVRVRGAGEGGSEGEK